MKFKTFTLSAATAALLATGAMAQNPAVQPENPPADTLQQQPADEMNKPALGADKAEKPAMDGEAVTKTTQTSTESIQFTSSASAGQMLASELMGTAVRNAADENLGDINDVIVDREGKPSVAIIGVGGFLGIGEKDVGVPFESLEFVTNDNKRVARLDITKEALEAAPTFVYQDEKETASKEPAKTN